MFKRINLQFLISYFGILPFLIIFLDKFFFQYFKPNILKDFCIFYSLIIFVFIGAVNWDLKKNIPVKLIFIGFLPSFSSIFIIIMFLFSYEVIYYLIALFVFQLILDSFIYLGKADRIIYLGLRIPLTSLVIISLLVI